MQRIPALTPQVTFILEIEGGGATSVIVVSAGKESYNRVPARSRRVEHRADADPTRADVSQVRATRDHSFTNFLSSKLPPRRRPRPYVARGPPHTARSFCAMASKQGVLPFSARRDRRAPRGTDPQARCLRYGRQ